MKNAWLSIQLILVIVVLVVSNTIKAQETPSIWSIAWSPDGTKIVVAPGYNHCNYDAPQDYALQVIDTSNYQVLNVLQFHVCPVLSLDWSLDGTKLIVNDGVGGMAIVWDMNTNKPVVASPSYSMPGRIVDRLSPNGISVANLSEYIQNVNIWDINTGENLFELGGIHDLIDPYSVTWDSNGDYLAVAYGSGGVALWDVENRQVIYRFDVGNTSSPASVTWSKDGSKIAAGSFDGSIRVWDVETRTLLNTFNAHTNLVIQIDFAPDSIRLASASFDGTVKVWNTITGELLETFANPSGGRVYALDWSPDGTQLAYGGVGFTGELTIVEPTIIQQPDTPTPVPPTLTLVPPSHVSPTPTPISTPGTG